MHYLPSPLGVIFATDVNESELAKARKCIYSTRVVQAVPPSSLRRFFRQVNGGFQVTAELRYKCMFSRHDLTKDPPFPRIDLVSCRNVLIYLEPILQRKVLETIAYALNPGGFLLLGKTEDIGAHASLFTAVEWKNKLFRKAR